MDRRHKWRNCIYLYLCCNVVWAFVLKTCVLLWLICSLLSFGIKNVLQYGSFCYWVRQIIDSLQQCKYGYMAMLLMLQYGRWTRRRLSKLLQILLGNSSCSRYCHFPALMFVWNYCTKISHMHGYYGCLHVCFVHAILSLHMSWYKRINICGQPESSWGCQVALLLIFITWRYVLLNPERTS